MACSTNGIVGDENFTCNSSLKTADFHQLSEYTVSNTNTSTDMVELGQNFLQQMPSNCEDSNTEHLKNSCANFVTSHETFIAPKVTSPTIFENAVKAVKNLFSPAKGHGIFTRNVPVLDVSELEAKKEMMVPVESTSNIVEQLPSTESTASLSQTRFENLLGVNEEDVNFSSLKRSSGHIDIHDNTNDSYTTTLSRMDDSFKSTVTHLDGYILTDVEKSSEQIAPAQKSSILDGSLDESIEIYENTLDNTLKKCSSISSSENGDTFEARADSNENIENKENNGSGEINFHEPLGLSLSEHSKEEFKDDIIHEHLFEKTERSLNILDCTNECTLSLQIRRESLKLQGKEDLPTKTVTSSGPPSKIHSSEGGECIDASDVDIVPEKVNILTRESAEKIQDVCTYSYAMEDVVDEECLSQFSTTNHSSETDCSIVSGKNEIVSAEKIVNVKCVSDLEKNFSTSTIVISKSELDGTTLNSGKDKFCQQSRLPQTNSEPLLFDQVNITDCQKSRFTENTSLNPASRNHSEKDKPFQSNEQTVLDLTGIGDSGNDVNLEKKQMENETQLDDSLMKKSKNELNDTTTNISYPLSERVSGVMSDINFKILSFTKGGLYPENGMLIKAECCLPSSARIPLASQKSYTVLHNPNSELNHPVVLHSSSYVEADKLNDMILGNNPFSDFNITYVGDSNSAELISDYSSSESKIISVPNDLNIVDRSPAATTLSSGIGMEFRSDDIDKININLVSESKNSNIAKNINEMPNIGPNDLKIDTCASTMSSESHVTYFEPQENLVPPNVVNEKEKNEMKKLENKTDLCVLERPPINEVLRSDSRDCSLTWTNENNSNVKGAIDSKSSFAGSDTSTMLFSGDGNTSVSITAEISLEKNGSNSSPSKKIVCNDQSFIDFHATPDARDAEPRNYNSIGENNSVSASKEIETTTFVSTENDLMRSLEMLKITDNVKEDSGTEYGVTPSIKDGLFGNFGKCYDSQATGDEGVACENLKAMTNDLVSGGETDLSQFIQEQFTEHDIEKICSVVGDIPELNLSKNIVIASQQFDKSFQDKIFHENTNSTKVNNNLVNEGNCLSSACFDFLDSIKGKPSSRDYSRESLYIKFDPLIQKKSSASFDVSEGDKENLIVSLASRNSNTTDSLISVTPMKQTVNASFPLSPLTPSSQKSESKFSTEKLNKLRELESEILRLREFYIQREELNKEKINNYESEIAKLTGKGCVLEEKLKESEEREKSLVRKLTVQNDSMNRLKSIIEEYLAYISKLTDQIEAVRKESRKQTEVLTGERDYYMNHLQSTEQAFSDVHSKYEKCKKAVEILKKNEETYKTNIEELKERVEQYSEKIKEVQENATREVNRLYDKMNEVKMNHTQEISRFKAQLRKTELTVQTVQEALEQKIKENQELAGICDELIEGKKCSR